MSSFKEKSLYIRNFIFGVEDSLVSTVGLLSGIAIAAVPRATIFLTGMVLVFVEAFSMGAGSFLSEQSAEEYVGNQKTSFQSISGGLIMFFSYLLAGFIPLSPYLILETNLAFASSIIVSLVALLLLGAISARVFGKKPMKSALRMGFVGGIAIAAGVVVGKLVNR